jgi:polo-like kinase 1
LVVQFVDFSSKYGLGYKLSNGSYGVLFNDSTKIITHPNLFHFDYIDRVRGASENQEKVS